MLVGVWTLPKFTFVIVPHSPLNLRVQEVAVGTKLRFASVHDRFAVGGLPPQVGARIGLVSA